MLKFMITFVADFAIVCREVAVYKPLGGVRIYCRHTPSGYVHEEFIINPNNPEL